MTYDEVSALFGHFSTNPNARMITHAEDGSPFVAFRNGGGWRECRIWEGYFDASLMLIRSILDSKSLAHNLIFPALFNLRHAIEIALKWHIRYAGGEIPKTAGHDLDVLVGAFRSTADDLDDEATYISDCMLDWVSELARVDPHSTTFRYAFHRSGSDIAISPERWDLVQLYSTAETLSLWFDGLSDQIVHSRD
jgi:hypothetical protein